jgi:thiosulfate reductase cytochrome b subunit
MNSTHSAPDAPANEARVATVTAINPRWLRTTHWLNAAAVALLVASGWRIYDAAPLFELYFPRVITLGGWLGGALQWHFAATWLLAGNGLVYLTLNVITGRFARRLLPLRLGALRRDVAAALRGALAHADPRHYNTIQRAAYWFAIADLVLLVLSGLVLWKPVQFPLLRDLAGGYEVARRVHFFAMTALVLFTVIHLAMVAIVPRSLRAMLPLPARSRP